MPIVATVPVTNFQTGTMVAPARSVPLGVQEATIQTNCPTGVPATPFTGFAHPFSNPAMSITFGVKWSWDGGVTFPGSTQGTHNGNPTGVWATDRLGNPIMAADVSLGLPFSAALGGHPNTYQAYGTIVGGPISFGLTISETTG